MARAPLPKAHADSRPGQASDSGKGWAGRVICVDEKTCIPARERKHPDHPTRAGRVRQAEFEYKRHGVVNLIAAFEVHTGRV